MLKDFQLEILVKNTRYIYQKNIAMGYVPYEGHKSAKGFPIGNFGKKYKVHLPKKYSKKPVDAVVVPIPFTQSFNANTREAEVLATLNK